MIERSKYQSAIPIRQNWENTENLIGTKTSFSNWPNTSLVRFVIFESIWAQYSIARNKPFTGHSYRLKGKVSNIWQLLPSECLQDKVMAKLTVAVLCNIFSVVISVLFVLNFRIQFFSGNQLLLSVFEFN